MEVKGCRARFYRGSWHAVISWEDGHGRHERHIGLGCASEEDARIAALELFYKARRGEICALRWCDVDLRRGTIWIRAAIGSDDGGKYAKAPKSGRHRDVAVPRALSEVLADWSAACKTSSAGRVGPRWHVVCDGDGGFVNPDYLTHAFTDFARFNGLEGAAGRRLTLHDLRHTAATVLISNGADVKTVQSVLGHSSAAITLDMYASADADAKRSAARILDLAI